MIGRAIALLVISACAANAQQPATKKAARPVNPALAVVSRKIQPDALRAHVMFLSSDLLEGRDTPSRGLDIAGEYAASTFQRLRLEPIGDQGFFQIVVLRPENPNSPKSRNVAALLRGSDPALNDTYVIVSSHYDHIGLAKDGEDRIFNGANDDASGVASVLDAAEALSSLPQRPKRSVIFLLFCGEEKGLRGSRYYGQHPLVPLEKTIAQLNLEQTGRTDDSEGPHVGVANLTGFDYSDLTQTLIRAASLTGIQMVKVSAASDAYFTRSDNASLARAGIPAHTLSVAYDFPDYHKVSDTWDKLDYENMAKVDRAVALAILDLANSPKAPEWNTTLDATKPYRDAAAKLAAK